MVIFLSCFEMLQGQFHKDRCYYKLLKRVIMDEGQKVTLQEIFFFNITLFLRFCELRYSLTVTILRDNLHLHTKQKSLASYMYCLMQILL